MAQVVIHEPLLRILDTRQPVGSCSVPATALIDQAHKILAFDLISVILIFLRNTIGPLCVHSTRLYCKHLLGRIVEEVLDI